MCSPKLCWSVSKMASSPFHVRLQRHLGLNICLVMDIQLSWFSGSASHWETKHLWCSLERDFCNLVFIVSPSIESLKNKTNVQKGGNVTLYCNVSGTPTPRVSWTRVSTGEKWFSKTVVVIDVQVKDLGEYKCEAINPYGNDAKSMFIFFPGKCFV